MKTSLALFPSLRNLRIFNLLVVAGLTTYLFLLPGISVVRELSDDGIRGPGIPARAWTLHRDLTPRFEEWARARIASGQASQTELHDVPTNEWPMFSAVFYLLATEQLQASWEGGRDAGHEAPVRYASGAVAAARDLLVDPSHHSWVRRHWGDGYLHRENVFFRSLLIAGLTSHEKLTHDGSSVAMLRDQVETLVGDLDASKVGLLHDYPGECYPIDVVAAIGFIRKADGVLGTDHSAFVARSLRAFEGPMTDQEGLVPYRTSLESGEQEQPSRGIGNSWVEVFAPDLWPDRAKDWYVVYERSFWQDRTWARGFREFSKRTPNTEWLMEVDAGPVLDGFGTAASAFGIAAARRNGRFDHAYALSAQAAAVSWPLPGGTLLGPRVLSHATAAPYLGETGLLYFSTVQPAPGVAVVKGGGLSGLVWFSLLVYFGVSALVAGWVVWSIRRVRRQSGDGPHPVVQAVVWTGLTLAAGALLWSGALALAVVALVLARELPILRRGDGAKQPGEDPSAWASAAAAVFRFALLGYLGYAGIRHAVSPQYHSWFGGISLAVHELGHAMFGPVGGTTQLMGGTIAQLVAPMAIGAYLMARHRDRFGAAVCGAWLSFSLWETAALMADASRELLPTCGLGGNPEHDWTVILTGWRLLNDCDAIAMATRGAALMTWGVSAAWGFRVALELWRSRRQKTACATSGDGVS